MCLKFEAMEERAAERERLKRAREEKRRKEEEEKLVRFFRSLFSFSFMMRKQFFTNVSREFYLYSLSGNTSRRGRRTKTKR